MKQLFIFDMDGVLTETSEQHYLAWKETALKIGIEINRELNEKLKGISRMASLSTILEHGNKLNAYSEQEKESLATKKNRLYQEMITHFTKDNLFEGVEELFIKIKSKGAKIAIGSASKNAPMLIQNMGIEKYIDYVVDPDEVKNGKPAPDIFLKASEVLGVKVDDCVGIEDAEAGIEAIKAAGMLAVGIGKRDILSGADILLNHVKEMIDMID